ncbi:MAG TPA: hypothetical protein VL157_12265, partial [Gemmatimonadaceae bacterium]|nr:hypothetical protein [Gemmatimonadaceae bacterium]
MTGEHLLRSSVRLAVVLVFDDEADPAQHAKPVGIERQETRLPGKYKNLVRARLANPAELGECLARLRHGQTQRGAEIAVPSPEHELGRLPEAVAAR